MKLVNPMSPKQKSILLKSLCILALIIVFFSTLSKTLFSGGETLTEYAEASKPDSTETPALPPANITTSPIPKNSSPPMNPTPEGFSPSTIPPALESISPDRITYKDEFYYEPLSEELITFITGISYPASGTDIISYDDLSYVHLLHYNFDGEIAEGELICNNAIAQDLIEIFYDLYVAEYQIEQVKLIEHYNGDDTASMLDNNTSCFNYRAVEGTDKLSKHAYGLAIDINPFYNPYITYGKDGSSIVLPEGSEKYADRTQSFPYKIDSSDLCYQLFTEHGFIWGGNWNSCKDYQHFQKAAD